MRRKPTKTPDLLAKIEIMHERELESVRAANTSLYAKGRLDVVSEILAALKLLAALEAEPCD